MTEAFALSGGLVSIDVGEPPPFVGFPSKGSTKQLSGSVDELVKNIANVIDQFTTGAIERRTASEFEAVWKAVFPNYARVMIALGTLAKALVPPLVLEQLASDSLSEMEADFRDHALVAFGSSIRDQALFTIWTLRKINDLSRQ